ncbi:hypothetical protein MHYP_G00090430 [Metynnis hypsauchen]
MGCTGFTTQVSVFRHVEVHGQSPSAALLSPSAFQPPCCQDPLQKEPLSERLWLEELHCGRTIDVAVDDRRALAVKWKMRENIPDGQATRGLRGSCEHAISQTHKCQRADGRAERESPSMKARSSSSPPPRTRARRVP